MFDHQSPQSAKTLVSFRIWFGTLKVMPNLQLIALMARALNYEMFHRVASDCVFS